MPSLLFAIVSKKKEQGSEPCSKIVSTLNFLENLDLILIVEATLLVRVRAPPETWTTKLNLSASLSLNW
ncbi:hypothetical protein [Bradyrhizobium paxllaeri]|uniref:hypothetical protein n=1 Tax=Bradyrhizobium paxllaeri TaxID=190148 RepID=UPI000810AF11|nr:hypothetical protein [Bradyrhizobium paxllaeri]